MTQPQEQTDYVNPFNGENVGPAVDYHTFAHAVEQIRQIDTIKRHIGTAETIYAQNGNKDMLRSAQRMQRLLDESLKAHMWTCRMYEP